MSTDTGRLHAGDAARAVRIPTGSITLEGELCVPANAEGLVLFAHARGSRGPTHRHERIAAHLRRAGLGTLILDLLTAAEEEEHGERDHLRFNMGLLTQRLVCAAHWVAEEDEARHLQQGFLGSGTGSGAALVAAADLGRTIGAVVSRGGRPDLAGYALRRVKAPTLLIVGEQDHDTLELNEEAAAMLDCPNELSIVPGANHLFDEPGAFEAMSDLASTWFLDHLRRLGGGRFNR